MEEPVALSESADELELPPGWSRKGVESQASVLDITFSENVARLWALARMSEEDRPQELQRQQKDWERRHALKEEERIRAMMQELIPDNSQLRGALEARMLFAKKKRDEAFAKDNAANL